MQKPKILIVEDENLLAKDIHHILNNLGYNVSAIASSGEEAIQKASDTHPDLVLMDIKLKGDMDGIEAAKKIIGRINIPVVYLTAHSDDTTLQRAKLTGPFGYILKPFDKKDLQIGIEMALYKHETELQLRKLSRAIEFNPCTVVITDTKGNIEYTNTKFNQLTGYSSKEAIGKNPRFLKSGKTSPEEYERLWRTITSGKEWRGEFCNKKKNGEHYWESASISPVKNTEGVITHFVAVKEDITESKRLEKEKQDMEIKMLVSSKLATLGKMAAGIAHEINQPLTYISSSIQSIREDFEMDDVDKESIVKTLEKSYRQVERINQIIQHLRTFGRADDLEMKNVIIKKVLDNTLLLLGEKMRLTNIDFVCKEDAGVPLIRGNENQLEQVFINLMQNSIYSIEEKGYKGGRINVEIKNMNEKSGIQIDFSDTGKGIRPEHLENIFDPFFTTKPVGKGTGLGLSIIYSIIQSHGGEITCKSEVGKGTTFVISL